MDDISEIEDEIKALCRLLKKSTSDLSRLSIAQNILELMKSNNECLLRNLNPVYHHIFIDLIEAIQPSIFWNDSNYNSLLHRLDYIYSFDVFDTEEI